MQASKIMPGVVYAILGPDKALLRFQVVAINTRRYQATGSPHDYKSTVEGKTLDGATATLTLEPNEVLGPYEEYSELAERKRREDAAREQEGAARVKAMNELWTLLYERSGQPRPNDPGEYRQPFRIGHHGMEIKGDGIKLLTEVLARKGAG